MDLREQDMTVLLRYRGEQHEIATVAAVTNGPLSTQYLAQILREVANAIIAEGDA